jgi:hypothetical protein
MDWLENAMEWKMEHVLVEELGNRGQVGKKRRAHMGLAEPLEEYRALEKPV